MIEYQLKDADENLFSLNGAAVTNALKNTWTQGSEDFSFDNKIIEKTYLPGSTKVGASRLMSRKFMLTAEKTNPDSAILRDEMNELFEFAARTKYLVDVTNDMQIEIVIDDISTDYEKGSLKKYASIDFKFEALTPYWEALTETTIAGTALADTIAQVSINNAGFLPSSPLIILTTTAAVPEVQMYLDSSQVGIGIEDSLFGTAGNLTMRVNCVSGEITIGTINRNASIQDGTGFFDFAVGSDTLNILPADTDVAYSISFFKRYFV